MQSETMAQLFLVVTPTSKGSCGVLWPDHTAQKESTKQCSNKCFNFKNTKQIGIRCSELRIFRSGFLILPRQLATSGISQPNCCGTSKALSQTFCETTLQCQTTETACGVSSPNQCCNAFQVCSGKLMSMGHHLGSLQVWVTFCWMLACSFAFRCEEM